MKKIFLTIIVNILFLQCNLLFSDDWEPFPINQTSYYKITDVYYTQSIVFFDKVDLLGSIGIINYDSINIINENHKEYFSKKYNKLKKDECLISKLDSLNSYAYDLSSIFPDYYSIINDTLTFKINFFAKNNDFNFKLPLNMNKDDNYIQSSYDSSIKYTVSLNTKMIAKERVTTFGIEDSIMIFSIERKRLPKPLDSTFEIILSKNFGFLSFVPLDLLDPAPISIKILRLELVSAIINSENYGETYNFEYRRRDLLEKPGDIRIYKEIWGYLGDTKHAFIRDSLMGIDDSGDGVFVVYNRQIISSHQGDLPNSNKNYSYSYYKKDSIIYSGYNAMVNALKKGETFLQSTKLFDKVPNKETEEKDDSLEVIAMPLLFKFVEKCGEKDLQIFYNYQAKLDRENCNLPTRYFIYRILDKMTDLWWQHGQNNPIFEGDHIIGYKNRDCEWGDLTWPPKGVSIKDIEENTINIYPNPASDFISVDLSVTTLNGVDVPNIQIFDVLGTKVMTVKTQNFVSLQNIDVSVLPPGVYFLRVGDRMMKFIKI